MQAHNHHRRRRPHSPERGLAHSLLTRVQEVNERSPVLGGGDRMRGLLSMSTQCSEGALCNLCSFGSGSGPVHIMTNPNRGRGGAHVNGHVNDPAPSTSQPNGTTRRPARASNTDDQDSDSPRGWTGYRQEEHRRPPVPPRGGFMRGRGFASRGQRGGFRGRGGYNAAPPLQS